MKISVGLYGTNAHQIALAMIQGFNKHYTLFRQTSREAKTRFEAADWLGVHKAVKERIRFYDDRVDECVERLRHEFDAASIDDATWQQIKLLSESGPLEFGLANGSLLKDGTLVIVGHGGSVLTSKDAGRAFTVVNRADRASLAGATDDAAGNLVLVGQGGVHLATPTGVEPGKKQ